MKSRFNATGKRYTTRSVPVLCMLCVNVQLISIIQRQGHAVSVSYQQFAGL